jgi:hypothetical protein
MYHLACKSLGQVFGDVVATHAADADKRQVDLASLASFVNLPKMSLHLLYSTEEPMMTDVEIAAQGLRVGHEYDSVAADPPCLAVEWLLEVQPAWLLSLMAWLC